MRPTRAEGRSRGARARGARRRSSADSSAQPAASASTSSGRSACTGVPPGSRAGRPKRGRRRAAARAGAPRAEAEHPHALRKLQPARSPRDQLQQLAPLHRHLERGLGRGRPARSAFFPATPRSSMACPRPSLETWRSPPAPRTAPRPQPATAAPGLGAGERLRAPSRPDAAASMIVVGSHPNVRPLAAASAPPSTMEPDLELFPRLSARLRCPPRRRATVVFVMSSSRRPTPYSIVARN